MIDCYPGLTNEQSGHDSDRGVANVDAVQRVLGLKEFDDSEAEPNEYMIIKIRQDVLDSRFGNVYDTVRRAWHVSPKKVAEHKFILVCLYGEVIAIYKNATWFKSPMEPDRWEFDAEEADQLHDSIIRERYLHKHLPKRYMKKGVSSPILYQS